MSQPRKLWTINWSFLLRPARPTLITSQWQWACVRRKKHEKRDIINKKNEICAVFWTNEGWNTFIWTEKQTMSTNSFNPRWQFLSILHVKKNNKKINNSQENLLLQEKGYSYKLTAIFMLLWNMILPITACLKTEQCSILPNVPDKRPTWYTHSSAIWHKQNALTCKKNKSKRSDDSHSKLVKKT